jgi:hypothetical protein
MTARFFLAITLIACFVYTPAFAAKPDRETRFEHADRNDDGTIDRKEWKMENKWEHEKKKERLDLNDDGVISPKERGMSWQHSRAKVNKPSEAKYDVNGNGWLEPAEVKEMLKDKHTLIKTKGKARVDSPIEAEYDTNKDGVIDSSEAVNLKKSLE